ncbi:polyprenyl synthetase family protein [Nitrincola sp. A-D6]|uniref:polyprenyl synthetase family protein n=1 Tax=Nitrincola sp. A-D6 TaxID=1545442 RepID=UPI000AAE9C9A|nr:farnesyl diphosphate synthase [Nitrincola sp. A-D6]
MKLEQKLQTLASRNQQVLQDYLTDQDSIHPPLQQAMLYSLLNGGKRIRPILVYLACEFCGGSSEQADLPAASIEMVHSYSLVHDDLPAMDNDELRRGKPTCHIAFDEATAILAGDALLTSAFELLSQPGDRYQPAQQLAMIQCLSRAAGERGMVQGQAFDLSHVGKPLSLEALQQMHALKTGALITAALELGALAASSTQSEKLNALKAFGQYIGLAFQVKDDLLDIEADTATLGKPAALTRHATNLPIQRCLGWSPAKPCCSSCCSRQRPY